MQREAITFGIPVRYGEIAWDQISPPGCVRRHRLPGRAAVLDDYGFVELPVLIHHADAVATLPAHHQDPFDRLLVAQAMVDDLVIVSANPLLKRYPAPVVWD